MDLDLTAAVGDDEMKKAEGQDVEGIFGFGKKDDKEKEKEKDKNKDCQDKDKVSTGKDGIVATQCECPRGQYKCSHAAKSTHSVEELFPPPNEPYNPLTREPTAEDRDWLRNRLNPHTLEAHSVPRIVESVGHQGFEAILASMALSEEERRAIQVATTGQRNNPNWHLFRCGRLTASNFGAVLRSKRVTASLLARVLGKQQALEGVLSVQWGNVNESKAIQAFTTETQMPVQESGLWLSPSGVLGASPDGLVGSSAILEAKCPYDAREKSISEAMQNKGFCVSMEGGVYSLRRDHPYWHQVQGQLHLTARETCYFIVWTTKQSVIITISRDDTWQSNLQVLEDFFTSHMLPQLG